MQQWVKRVASNTRTSTTARGKIIEKTDDSFCVRLVDIGSMKNVRASDLKELDPDLMDLPPLVFECSLAGKRPKLGEI